MLIDCAVCKKKVAVDAQSCPHCGAGTLSFRTNDPKKREMLRVLGVGGGKKCPHCGSGNIGQISRGRAFGSGHLLGAFSKSSQCNNCGGIW